MAENDDNPSEMRAAGREEMIIELLTSICERLARIEARLERQNGDSEILAQRREKNRLAVARCRAAKKGVILQDDVTLHKEGEREREKFPPHPLIERKTKVQESSSSCCDDSRVRARDVVANEDMVDLDEPYDELLDELDDDEADEGGLVGPADEIKLCKRLLARNRRSNMSYPTLEELIAYAHVKCLYYNEDTINEFYRIVAQEYDWCHPKDGRPIRNWRAYFRQWRTRKPYFDRLNADQGLPVSSNWVIPHAVPKARNMP